MTIDEAIEQYKHIADSYDSVGNTDDAMEARQLAEWLRTARGAEKAGRYFTRDIRELKQRLEDSERENAKLRELVADLWEFGFSKSAGANSVEEWHRRHGELRERTYELLGVNDA